MWDRKEWLTREDLANYLNASTRTINRYINKGLLPPPKKIPGMGPRWHIDIVNKWLGIDEYKAVCEAALKKTQQFQR